jgi:hypothetical protein
MKKDFMQNMQSEAQPLTLFSSCFSVSLQGSGAGSLGVRVLQ